MINEYREYIKTITKSPKEMLNEMTEEKIEIAHLIMGLSGEVGELYVLPYIYLESKEYIEKFIIEIGDCFFYLESLKNFAPHWIGDDSHLIKWEEGRKKGVMKNKKSCKETQFNKALYKLTWTVLYLDNMFKKYIFHNIIYKGTEGSNTSLILERRLTDIDINLSLLLEPFNYTKEDILKLNIEKLKKRYPENKYTDEQAKKRVDV